MRVNAPKKFIAAFDLFDYYFHSHLVYDGNEPKIIDTDHPVFPARINFLAFKMTLLSEFLQGVTGMNYNGREI